MKAKISILLFIIFILFSQIDFIFAQTGTTQTQPIPKIPITTYYNILRPAADIKCLSGDSALAKITNCIRLVARALQYLAVILFVIGLTYTAGLMIIVPFKTDSINQAKKILLWIIIGFIILFIAEKIMELIKQLVE